LDITPAKICSTPLLLLQIALLDPPNHRHQATLQVMPDDHSELVPPLPIPNRTVKRLCADDSAATSVKVGNRQACIMQRPRSTPRPFAFSKSLSCFVKRGRLRRFTEGGCEKLHPMRGLQNRLSRHLTQSKKPRIISFLCCRQTRRFVGVLPKRVVRVEWFFNN
jgi:hypothetical protein